MQPTEQTRTGGEDGRAFVVCAPWRFALTMSDIPQYTVRGETPDDEFNEFVLLIRRVGYERRFGKATYTYLNTDGHRYYTMGVARGATVNINRSLLTAP
jgi:hypothetical protein